MRYARIPQSVVTYWQAVRVTKRGTLRLFLDADAAKFPLVAPEICAELMRRALQRYDQQMDAVLLHLLAVEIPLLRLTTVDTVRDRLHSAGTLVQFGCAEDYHVWLEAQELGCLFAMKET